MLTSIWRKYFFVITFFILSLAMGLTIIHSWEQEEVSVEAVDAADEDHGHYEMTSLNKQSR